MHRSFMQCPYDHGGGKGNDDEYDDGERGMFDIVGIMFGFVHRQCFYQISARLVN